MKRAILPGIMMLVILSGCKKRPDPDTNSSNNKNALTVIFENTVNGQPLVLGSTEYVNANGDTFTVSKYKYYISNISLIKENKNSFDVQDGYYLVDQAKDDSRHVSIGSIPDGKYVGIRFLIGVDSARNTSGAQTGALDPVNDMFWDWNTGYIMAKMEGFSPQVSSDPNNVAFHIGGYAGKYSVLKWVELSLPAILDLQNGSSSHDIHITSDLAEWFKTPNAISFKDNPFAGSVNKFTASIADNYADMFHVDHVD